MNFTGKRAVVVGGSKGLGLDVVEALAAAGCRVAVLARSAGGLPALQQRLPGLIGLHATDIGDPASVRATFAAIGEAFGGIDFLILNAAVATPRRLAQSSDDEIRQSLAINLLGPICCLREAQPLLRDGTVLFVSSESTHDPFPMLALYAGVKAGMETFLRGVRSELYQSGRNRVVIFRVGSMGGTAFGEGWDEQTRAEFFEVAAKAGNLGRSGAPMSTRDVAASMLQVLAMPATTNVHEIDFRAADAY
jgi:NAD(P)-dependent dehydrogenase (short-subunit alcohol dehydrogenase family)